MEALTPSSWNHESKKLLAAPKKAFRRKGDRSTDRNPDTISGLRGRDLPYSFSPPPKYRMPIFKQRIIDFDGSAATRVPDIEHF
jgi:hypothetical protein